MKSSNPVFTRSEGFNGQPYAGFRDAPQAHGAPYPGPQYGVSGHGPLAPTHVRPDRMTIDSVVQRSGISLGVVVLVAGITWAMTGDVWDPTAAATLYTASLVGGLGAFVLSMVNSFKKVVSPGLVIAFAVFEGVMVGAFSKVMAAQFGNGIVVGAVLGTMAAFAGTLTAYRFFDIKVTPKFRMWVIGMMFGFVAVTMLDFGLHFFGRDFGFNGLGGMGLLSSVIGLGIGVLMLILDFDFVERGVDAGLPERESWRAAFALTVTLVWIYIELLRILAIFSRD